MPIFKGYMSVVLVHLHRIQGGFRMFTMDGPLIVTPPLMQFSWSHYQSKYLDFLDFVSRPHEHLSWNQYTDTYQVWDPRRVVLSRDQVGGITSVFLSPGPLESAIGIKYKTADNCNRVGVCMNDCKPTTSYQYVWKAMKSLFPLWFRPKIESKHLLKAVVDSYVGKQINYFWVYLNNMIFMAEQFLLRNVWTNALYENVHSSIPQKYNGASLT